MLSADVGVAQEATTLPPREPAQLRDVVADAAQDLIGHRIPAKLPEDRSNATGVHQAFGIITWQGRS